MAEGRDNSQVKGRIYYIDPNELASEYGGITLGNGAVGDNVTWKPEDLNYSVDLQVIIPNRDSCGQISDDGVIFTITGAKETFKKYKTFMEGSIQDSKDWNYLSDNYTDISYQEIRENNAGSKEALGIKSIDIEFDSHFFPQVTMKMTDIRGASLFSPEELATIQNLGNRVEEQQAFERRKQTCQNFFSAIFRFPSPRFALSVKGFFGTRVTFMLSVSDFNANFDANSGNFDVTIKFIGYMYGLYSDIPFNYLLAAPYIGSNTGDENEYWKGQVNSGVFNYSDGTEILTFFKFLNVYNEMPEKYKNNPDIYSNGNLKEYNDKLETRDLYKNVLSGYQKIIRFCDERSSEFGARGVSFGEKNSSITFSFNNANDFQIPSGFVNVLINFSNIWNKYKHKPINGVNDNSLRDFKNFNIENFYSKRKDGSSTVTINGLSSDAILLIEDEIVKLEDETSSILKKSSKELLSATKEILGFTPSIENIFRMLFAHLDTFIFEFYSLLGTINKKKELGTRNFSNFKTTISLEDTDIYSKGTNDCFIPPFPAVYQESQIDNKRVRRYPGEINGLTRLDEVSFVESIFKGIDGVKTKAYEALENLRAQGVSTLSSNPYNEEPGSITELNSSRRMEFIPISVSDVFYEGKNPYSFINISNNNNIGEDIFYIMICRLLNAGLYSKKIFDKKGNLNQEYIDIEIKNLFRTDEVRLKNNESLNIFLQEKYDPKSIFKKIDEKHKNHKFKLSFATGETEQDWAITCGDREPIIFGNLDAADESIKRYEDIGGFHYLQDTDFVESFATNGNFWEGYDVAEFFGEDNNPKKNHGGIYYNNRQEGELEWIPSEIYGQQIFGQSEDSLVENFMVPTLEKKGDNVGALDSYGRNAVFYYNTEDDFSPYNKDDDYATYYMTDRNIFIGKSFTENDRSISAEEVYLYYKAYILLCTMQYYREVYGFEDNNSSILLMPRYMSLYLGAELWHSRVKSNDNFFNRRYFADELGINNNGLCIIRTKSLLDAGRRKGFKSGIKLSETSELDIVDGDGTLVEEFKKWAKDAAPRILSLIDDERTSSDIVTGFTEDLSQHIMHSGTELQRMLLKLYAEKTAVIKLEKRKGKKDSFVRNTIKLRDIQNIYTRLYAEMYGDDYNSDTNEAGYDGSDEDGNVSDVNESGYRRANDKEELYYKMKNLYDKWLSTYSSNKFKLKEYSKDRELSIRKEKGVLNESEMSEITEFDSFVFKDTFYNNIGDKFLINPSSLYNIITNHGTGKANMSMLEVISTICFDNKLLFVPLPVFNNISSIDTLRDAFIPHSLYDCSSRMGYDYGNTYLIMYTHEASNKLNVNEYYDGNSVSYMPDGFDIADSFGKVTPEALNLFNSSLNNYKDNYDVCAFGVTFAKQNQTYFKNVSLNMETPRETDFSIQNRFLLAGQGTHGDTNSPMTVGQNMFSIYSNRAYDCSVDMLGCMNIMPMMYFQLNNVPMFRGAYRILSVSHHIEPGSMTTSFKGQRISKNAIPFNYNVIDIETLHNRAMGGAFNGSYEYTNGNVNAEVSTYGQNGNASENTGSGWTNDIIQKGSSSRVPSTISSFDFSPQRAADAFKTVMTYRSSSCGRNITSEEFVDGSCNKTREPVRGLTPYGRTCALYGSAASQGYCSSAVRNAISAGYNGKVSSGITIGNGFWTYENLASKFGYTLREIYHTAGLSRGEVKKMLREHIGSLKIGDIMIMQKPGTGPQRDSSTSHGHICMLVEMQNGKIPIWCSDYNQEENCYVYSNKQGDAYVLDTDMYLFRQCSIK